MLDILVVDDEPSIRVPLGHALRARGHRVSVASDGAEAMSRLDAQVFGLVVSDVKLPRVDGFTILRRLRKECPGTDVVLMTAFGTIADAVAAMKERAVDYVTKPFDLEEMVLVVERVDERRRLLGLFYPGRAQRPARRSSDHLVGRSPQVTQLRDQVAAIADSAAAVLLTGESGTGKELVARMIHDRSPRREKPFVAVNCAAIPASLIEAELFGHERGAFTGAFKRRAGRFKAADGGTLFLDEIGEMPPELQPKMLRVLQEGVFEPIGTNTSAHVDVRVISASNRDLKAAVADGGFRKDLYYRIRVFDMRLPPLRERRGDLP
jgi:two-component system response regulator AtoC